MSKLKEYLNQVKVRCDVATEGPWIEVDGERILKCLNSLPEESSGLLADVYNPIYGDEQPQDEITNANAKFIAHARQDVEVLLEMVKDLRKQRNLALLWYYERDDWVSDEVVHLDKQLESLIHKGGE